MYKNEEHQKGKFWILNRFVRTYARKLPLPAQMVYVALCCYAGTGNNPNKEYRTFVGCRRIADDLNINKDTVAAHIKTLEASGFIRRLVRDNGKATEYIIYTDPINDKNNEKPSQPFGHKDNKEGQP